MRVTDLLQLDDLALRLCWGDMALLDRDIGGVTVTDLEDPTRFVRPGDVVLSGLVWWTPRQGRAKAERFVAALRASGATALLAGEETHGTVPAPVVDSCREHRLPVLAVPASTNFRTITDAVYRRQWGRLGPPEGTVLPEAVHRDLDRLLAEHAPLSDLLNRACEPFPGFACHVVSATGRTLARTAAAAPVARRPMAENLRRHPDTAWRLDAEPSPYAGWYLYVPAPAGTPPRAVQEIADVLTRHHRAAARRDTRLRQASNRLLATLDAPPGGDLRPALRECGLPDAGPYLVATLTVDDVTAAAGALRAAFGASPCAVGELPHGEAVAVAALVSCSETRVELSALWPDLHACDAGTPLPGGLSGPVRTPEGLWEGLAQARHAAAANRAPAAIASAEDVTTLDALLAGLPSGVREGFSSRVLGPLLHYSDSAPTVLLDTLKSFLAHNGSWTRVADELHIHVNTVRYRIQRVEQLTGRDLSRLDHRLDLRAALLCR